MKIRISKSEVDLVIAKLKRKGEEVTLDMREGTKRIVETNKTRLVFTTNGWVDIQRKL